MMSEETQTKPRDPREIMNSIFSRTDADQKKLLNNWCRNTHGVALQIWTRQVDLNSSELKRFLVEVDKALESGNWAFFDPDENNPSEGQAVETNPLPSNPTTEEEEEEEDEVPPKQDGRGVPANRLKPQVLEEDEEEDTEEEIPAPITAERVPPIEADPLAGLVELLAPRILAKIGGAAPSNLNDQIDKRIQNGAFPVKKVQELIDERYAHSIATFLFSQPSEVVDRALEIYESAVEEGGMMA